MNDPASTYVDATVRSSVEAAMNDPASTYVDATVEAAMNDPASTYVDATVKAANRECLRMLRLKCARDLRGGEPRMFANAHPKEGLRRHGRHRAMSPAA